MKQIKLTIVLALLLTSCTQRGCQRLEKHAQFSDHSYRLEVYSGGKMIHSDTFNGVIIGEEGTDGFYYFKGKELIELSGDYVIKSLDN